MSSYLQYAALVTLSSGPLNELLKKASACQISRTASLVEQFRGAMQQTEQTAAQLTEERNRIWHENEIVEKELALAKRKNVVKEVHEGYPLLYVYMVALFNIWVSFGPLEVFQRSSLSVIQALWQCLSG